MEFIIGALVVGMFLSLWSKNHKIQQLEREKTQQANRALKAELALGDVQTELDNIREELLWRS